jgi:ABC-2 type transport system ATP-binding protein
MADITALCDRVLLIHEGRLFYDGSLELLSERLAPWRQVRVELASPQPAAAFANFGEIESLEGSELRLLIPRQQLTASVSRLLAEHQVVDLEVSDPPIEELIGRLFRQGSLEEPGP